MCFFIFNPGPVWRVPIPNRYTAKAKLCFCKNNKRRIISHRWFGRAKRESHDSKANDNEGSPRTNDLHCCKPARLLQLAPSGGRPHRPLAQWNPRECLNLNSTARPHCSPSDQVVLSTWSGARSRSAHSASNTLIQFISFLHHAGRHYQL